MRPVVKTALRRLWRDETTLQIGVDPQRAVVIGGLGPAHTRLLCACDGAHTDADLRALARKAGLDVAVVDRLLAMLLDASVLDDAATNRGPLAGLPAEERDRLAPDLASLSILSGALDGGTAALARRRQASVGVAGAGRVGASIAALLAAAGVGQVVVDDPHPCRPEDLAPAGLSRTDVGSTRGAAVHAALDRAGDVVETRPPRAGRRFDVMVVAPTGAVDSTRTDELMRTGTPHLLATVREVCGVVGPFVVPGRTACLRCLDLHRVDRDPAWPLLAAQLSTGPRRSQTQACDVVLATLVASVSALQVLTFLDGSQPAAGNATLETTLPDWRLRRRPWSLHPACGCHWFSASGDVEPGRGDDGHRSVTMGA